MQKHYNYLNIDLDKKIHTKLKAKQGDSKSRYILVNLISNSTYYDLTGTTVKIYGIKKDKTIFFNHATVTNSKQGQFEIELTNQALAVVGEIEIQILILGTNQEKLTTFSFFIDVEKTIVDDAAIESTNEFTALTTALSSVQNIDNRFREVDEQFNTIENKTETNKSYISTVNQRVNLLSSLPQGSTTGDAELMDGRIDALGFSSHEIGENIRNFQRLFYTNDDMNISCNEWELGIISTTSGNDSETSKSKFARTKGYMSVQVGSKLNFKATASNGNTPKLTLYYYDDNKTFIKSIAVENKEIVMEYSTIRLCYFYLGATVDVILTDAMATNITTKISFDGIFDRIPELQGLFDRLDKTPNMIGTESATKSIDFNMYKIGYWFISCSESQSNTFPLINSPFGAKWGYYELLAIPFTINYTLQIAICSNGAKRGIFIRTYNSSTGAIQIDWKVIDSDLSRAFKEYIALGDSITWGHISGSGTESSPFVRADYPYPTTVANALGLNVTYGAQTGCGWLQVSGNKTAISIVDSINFSNYNLVTLAFGRNDYNGNQPLGEKTDMYPTQKTILGAMNYCLKKIYTDSPMIDVVVITPLNEATKGDSNSNYAYGTANSQGYTLKQLCTAIRELCEEKNINCIDNSKGSIVTAYNCNSGIFIDKLHPTNTFYHVLGQYYAGKIGSFFQASRNY